MDDVHIICWLQMLTVTTRWTHCTAHRPTPTTLTPISLKMKNYYTLIFAVFSVYIIWNELNISKKMNESYSASKYHHFHFSEDFVPFLVLNDHSHGWRNVQPYIPCITWTPICTRFGGTYTKIGTIQRRLAWPLRKDDTQIREAFHIFRFEKKMSKKWKFVFFKFFSIF